MWYQHVAFTLMNVSMRRFLGAYVDREENKSIFCFFNNILLCHFDLVVSWIVRIDDLLIVHIFISFFNWLVRIAQVYWETNFLLVFYCDSILCHFSSHHITHEFMSRINLKNFWSSQWSTPISLWDLSRIFWGERFSSCESVCNINNCQCIIEDFLTSWEPLMGKEMKISLMTCIWRFNIKSYSPGILCGRQVCLMACHINQSFATFSETLVSLTTFFTASNLIQKSLGLK